MTAGHASASTQICMLGSDPDSSWFSLYGGLTPIFLSTRTLRLLQVALGTRR